MAFTGNACMAKIHNGNIAKLNTRFQSLDHKAEFGWGY